MTHSSSLRGRRIGVTAVRKADEQIAMFERRGAEVQSAPALSPNPTVLDDDHLRERTTAIFSRPVDVFVATTGVGVNAWFHAAGNWGLQQRVIDVVGRAEVLARGPKSTAALRSYGLHEHWSAESERLGDDVRHLDERNLVGTRIVLQEHGQSLGDVAEHLRDRGADVEVVTVYRIERPADQADLHRLVESAIARRVDAITFTSAPAVDSFMAAAAAISREPETVEALQGHVVVACVGPVAADAFAPWRIPAIFPARFRLGALVKLVEQRLAVES